MHMVYAGEFIYICFSMILFYLCLLASALDIMVRDYLVDYV